MAATTQANVLLIAPELSTLDQDLWDLILADVTNDLSSSVFGNKLEQAARYLTAHRLTLLKAGISGVTSGPVTKEKVGDVMKEYSEGTRFSATKASYARTQYGLTFLELRNQTIGAFRVVKPGV